MFRLSLFFIGIVLTTGIFFRILDPDKLLNTFILAQHDFSGLKITTMKWCTTSEEEQYKCQNFSRVVERDKGVFDDDYLDVRCFPETSTDNCIAGIDQDRANIMSLDSGEVFIAGRYHSLVPVMQEIMEDALTNYYAVAVIKKDTLPDVRHLRDLRDKKACFAYVGSQAGWNIPVHTVRIFSGHT